MPCGSMALDNSSASSDEIAKLQAQILLLKGQNADLATNNAQLAEELERAKAELRETQALLGRAAVDVARQSQSTESPLIVYTPPEASSSQLKRPRSGSLDHADGPLLTAKKSKGKTHGDEVAGSRRSTRSSVIHQTSRTNPRLQPYVLITTVPGKKRKPTIEASGVKESPGKPVKFEVPPAEVITIDDKSNIHLLRSKSQVHQAVAATRRRDLSKHATEDDSDLEDPNVSREELSEEFMTEDGTPPSVKSEQSDVALGRDSRSASGSLRRSARFLSTSPLTTLSGSATLGPTTPDVEDKPDIDRKPKREPKREPKQEVVFRLSSDVVSLYLDSAKPFTINPPPMTLEIRRTFLRLAYGGSDQQFVQYIPAVRNPGPSFTLNANGVKVRKDKRRLVFPMLHLNPSMPSTPGAPGLIFASRHEILYNPPWTLFCKRNSGKAVWLYLGEYENELVGKLTPEQFREQSDVVKHSWANLIMTQKRQVCYMSMRARIVLRAAGLFPNDDKEQEKELVDEEVERIKNGNGEGVTMDQILQAFSDGDEGVDVIRMKCVKYDHVFAKDIAKRFKDYPRMRAAAKASKRK